MLIGIPDIISPELLKILHEMGHGDEIVIGDGNFPAASCGKRLVRCDGHGVLPVLNAVLQLFPLDTYVESPVILMEAASNGTAKPVIWEEYEKTVKKACPTAQISQIERFLFYERAKNAYAVIATSEKALYANIILKKGVISNV